MVKGLFELPKLELGKLRLGIVAIASLLPCSSVVLAQSNTNWNVGGAGVWSTAGNWTGGFVPNNGNGGTNWNVFIDNGNAASSVVDMDITSTINQLNIDAGDVLNILNNRFLTINNTGQAGAGVVNNNGNLNLNCEQQWEPQSQWARKHNST